VPTITVGDLVGRRVVDRSGAVVGTVQDVVVRRTAPGVYEVTGLVAGRSALAGHWGYGGSLRPPTPLRGVLRWMRRHERHVRWEQVAAVEEGVVRVAVDAATLDRWWHGREPD
jgi:sporulation protein YlmC with PRC-barrel domain